MPVISQPDKITKVLYQRSETKLSAKANATGKNADCRAMLPISGVSTTFFFLPTGIVVDLSAVAQRRCNGVDRQLNALTDPFVGFACAVAFHEFDLEQVERLDIGQT